MSPSSRPVGARLRSSVRRLAAIGTLVGIAASLLVATSASAHVQVSGTDTSRGGEGVVSFRVPTESATASTIGLTVTFPAATPIVSALTQPIAGWTADVATTTLSKPVTTDDGTVDTYVTSVTWTADSVASGIHPGSFQTFSVSVSPLPNAATVTFPALQRYSDGTTVDWNETSSGGAEPAHPAPVLTLTPAASHDPGTTSTSGHAATHSGTSAAAGGSASSVPTASAGTTWTTAAALIAALLALLAALVALVRTYRPDARRE